MTPKGTTDRDAAWLQTELCRRAFLGHGAKAIAGFGLGGLLGRVALAEVDRPRWQLQTASAKRIVLIFLNGGFSQLDATDEKPMLQQRRGQEIPASVHMNKGVVNATAKRGAFPAVGTEFAFRRFGECGMNLSELIPNIGAVADELTLIRTTHTDHVLHENAISSLLTGTPLQGRPSWGSWITYGLGSENQNLPSFVVLVSNSRGDSPAQPRLWSAAFLPGKHQGVQFRGGAAPVLDLKTPPGLKDEAHQARLDAIRALNEIEAASHADPETRTRIESYEMAARMQTSVPELTDLKNESAAVLERYGADPSKPSFANNCLLARRLVERDVRFVQLCDGGWDHHGAIPRVFTRKCEQIDKPIGALIGDLKERGLLDDTVVVIGTEFGRTPHCDGPLSRGNYGRDHHNLAYTTLVAGGGFKGGLTYGETDEWGYHPIADPVHVNDLQATVLKAMGIDHERHTFRHEGRDYRLTDVRGEVIEKLLA